MVPAVTRKAVMRTRIRRRMTMLQLVQIVQKDAGSDEEVVTRVTKLVNSGRVTLCGIFAAQQV